MGAVLGDNPATSTAAGLLAVSAVGSEANTTMVWYQIEADDNGTVFATRSFEDDTNRFAFLG